ncbi:hypothetical protein LguiA_000484 [Lonicera macranthoides]
MADQDKFELEKGNEEPIIDYHSPNLSSEWRFNGANLPNTTMGLIPPMAICKGDILESSSCSSASMLDSSFCPPIWDQPTNSHSLGFCDISVQNNVRTSNTLGFRKGNLVPPRSVERTLDMSWAPQNSIPKEALFLPTITTPGILPQSLSHCPTDSGFIERAARFSCFSGGNFGDMTNPFVIPESASPYSRAQEVFGGNGLNSLPCGQSQKNEIMTEGSKECGPTEGSPLKSEAKLGVGVSDEADFNGGGGREGQSPVEGTSGENSTKGRSRKRKGSGQDNEHDQPKGAPQTHHEAKMDNTEIQKKGDQHTTITAKRPPGKNVKEVTQASDAVKEEYIHVRARRGQATNSHSLAERVRREKISERMKFLQDLVPGCNKVTGKAVMLDEIINYVQSLQRQVEFLSMKLATVNPRMEFNIEGILTKDIIHSRAGPSSSIGFPPDMAMPYPPLHLSQPVLNQAGHAGMGNPSDALRRTINSHFTTMSAGFKEQTSQVPNVWEDELHNIVQMGFNSSVPLDNKEVHHLSIVSSLP